VPILLNEILVPLVFRIKPGLRARKSAAGIATFCEVMLAIIL